jgi:hypothetical protein
MARRVERFEAAGLGVARAVWRRGGREGGGDLTSADGNGLDSKLNSENIFYHMFTHANIDSNVLEYKYKIDVSNSDLHRIFSRFDLKDNIYQFSLLKISNYKIT